MKTHEDDLLAVVPLHVEEVSRKEPAVHSLPVPGDPALDEGALDRKAGVRSLSDRLTETNLRGGVQHELVEVLHDLGDQLFGLYTHAVILGLRRNHGGQVQGS